MTTEHLNAEFECIVAQLKSFLLRITASQTDAEDITHDCYLKALEKRESFRGDASFKTWVFAIASNLAKDNLRAQKRWTPDVTDIARNAAKQDPEFWQEAKELQTHSPQGHYEAKEHIAFCFTCISKSLPLEQQLCIFLKEVYAFKVSDISLILDCTEAMVKYYLHNGRSTMINIFEGRCALINKEGVCHQCSELNGVYNPEQNSQTELIKIELVRDGNNPDKDHLFDLRLRVLQELDPFESPAAALQLHHLEFNRKLMDSTHD